MEEKSYGTFSNSRNNIKKNSTTLRKLRIEGYFLNISLLQKTANIFNNESVRVKSIQILGEHTEDLGVCEHLLGRRKDEPQGKKKKMDRTLPKHKKVCSLKVII